MKTYYITTPIYYVNDVPHIGHAYTSVACDMIARFMRLDGYAVKFLTGTDEHGKKVATAADASGIAPQDFVNRVSQNFQELLIAMNFSCDGFIRTTHANHITAAQALWEKISDNGYIYLDTYAGWYAVRDEAFYLEADLVDGKAPTGAEVEWLEELSYFFALSKWQKPLLDFYETHPNFIAPLSRRNEVMNFVKSGLRDFSISRTSFSWGIPVPGDPAHVMYVWFDALTNYISAAGYPDIEGERFYNVWPADLHMVGKDILRFHAVYWPAMLMSAGLSPPKKVFAHGFWTNAGHKMSKSLGNGVDPFALIEKYGVDPVRYFMLSEIPFGHDGDFLHQSMVNRLNSNLSNDLGNLVQRSLSMIAVNCGNQLPVFGALTAEDNTLLDQANKLIDIVRPLIVGTQALHKYCAEIWNVVRAANQYVDYQAPWALKRTDPARMQTVLYVLAETLRCVGILLQPVMPASACKILDALSVPQDKRSFSSLSVLDALTPGTYFPDPEPIFPRMIDEVADA